MKRGIVLAGILGTLVGLVGCGADLRERLIAGAVEELNKASSNLGTIKENVEKWEKEKKDADKTRFLKMAVEATENFKNNGKRFQEIKQEGEKLEPSSQEQIEEYRQKYRKNLGPAVERLAKEQEGLNQAVARAEKISPTALADLKQKLQMAQGEFEVLTKQR